MVPVAPVVCRLAKVCSTLVLIRSIFIKRNIQNLAYTDAVITFYQVIPYHGKSSWMSAVGFCVFWVAVMLAAREGLTITLVAARNIRLSPSLPLVIPTDLATCPHQTAASCTRSQGSRLRLQENLEQLKNHSLFMADLSSAPLKARYLKLSDLSFSS